MGKLRPLTLMMALLTFGFHTSSLAQSESDQVKAVIQSLFEGMKTKNADLIEAAFYAEAPMQTVIAGENGSTLGSNAVSDFLNRISSTPADTQLDERILDYQIKIDGDLAAAWTPYEFYVNDQFSHCGVNSFQLVKMTEGWKIVYIIDTRRKEGC